MMSAGCNPAHREAMPSCRATRNITDDADVKGTDPLAPMRAASGCCMRTRTTSSGVMKSEVRMAPEHAAAEVSSHVMRGGSDAAPSLMESKHAETFRESEHPATTLRYVDGRQV